ncbi:translation initiation factor [Saprospira grandis]|uniref:translation initiation factor n=1 Tax=Saprospira grandis TaxID=1008 RepID=UPI0022DD7012|nr:translation initiation factor [Saprospira grandis]WBM75731.1 translation initiation factor [Saprospira grandis]
MAKKKKKLNFYSTDPNFEWNDEPLEEELLPPQQQRLRVQIDRKKRGGKEVTLVTGFVGPEEELKALGKKLKASCGVGGSAKDGEIIVQGKQAEKVLELLKKWGYSQTKRSGGN